MNQNQGQKRSNLLLIMVILVVGVTLVYSMLSNLGKTNQKETNYSAFLDAMEKKTVEDVEIKQGADIPTGTIFYRLKGDPVVYFFYTSDVNTVQTAILSYERIGYKVNYVVLDISRSLDLLTILSLVMMGIMLIFIISTLFRGMGGGGANARMLDFGKSRAVMAKGNKVNFRDVAGLEEEKEDLAEIVDFLKDPEKYTSLGARIPKGVLLVGPPGTGKTLLAKAIAGEAGVPFFTISGSDFVEMFVGVGASRVRDLFQEAKKNSPCIVFIDEIDAVARHRGSGLGGGHDEREQTLNQLLVEMDGFGVNSGIIVMAATNRADILDPAILRPGRFDRKITVSRPDVKGREAILRVHARNKPLSDDVDLNRVAQTTAGFAGADLENLLNEAAIIAAKENRKYLNQEDVDKAFIKVGIGAEKKSRILTEKDKRITAYHEAGHAILFHVLPDVGPVHTISVIPTGMGAAGYTMPLPDQDYTHMTKSHMLQDVMVSLGGRIAEDITFGDVTTGASQDIKQATELVRSMVMKYGMSDEAGMIHYGGEDSVFIGRDYGHTREYGEETAALLDKEVRRIMQECYDKARAIILEHKAVLDAVAEELVKKEKLYQQEFEAIFNSLTSEQEA